jgi:hypothetical protein
VGIPIKKIFLISNILNPLAFFSFNFSNLPLIPERSRAAEAANNARIKIRVRSCSGRAIVPAKKAKGTDDKKGRENFSERCFALAKVIIAIPATIMLSICAIGGTANRLIPKSTRIAI